MGDRKAALVHAEELLKHGSHHDRNLVECFREALELLREERRRKRCAVQDSFKEGFEKGRIRKLSEFATIWSQSNAKKALEQDDRREGTSGFSEDLTSLLTPGVLVVVVACQAHKAMTVGAFDRVARIAEAKFVVATATESFAELASNALQRSLCTIVVTDSSPGTMPPQRSADVAYSASAVYAANVVLLVQGKADEQLVCKVAKNRQGHSNAIIRIEG